MDASLYIHINVSRMGEKTARWIADQGEFASQISAKHFNLRIHDPADHDSIRIFPIRRNIAEYARHFLWLFSIKQISTVSNEPKNSTFNAIK